MADQDWTPEKEAAARQNAAGLNSYLTNLTGFNQGGASRTALENAGASVSRNLGITPPINKPDGTTVAGGFGIKSVAFGQGLLEKNDVESRKLGIFSNFNSFVKPALQPERATVDVSSESASSSIKVNVGGGILQNPLENFASYNTLWTMAALSPQQYNNPGLYRGDIGQLSNIVFSSAGRFDSQRVGTAYGKPEFYINNFKMVAVVAGNKKTGNQNAVEFEFEIYEPYSMGLLLQSMQRAAKLAGFNNYLEFCPYVLRMDIQGYDELGNVLKSIRPKFFTMKLTECTFNVTESGSVYRLTAVPMNHMGYSDLINMAYKDVRIGGDPNGKGDVQELLISGKNSLMNFLNKAEKRMVEEGLIGTPDEYVIQFPLDANTMFSSQGSVPTSNTATVNPVNDSQNKTVGADTSGDPESAVGPLNEIALSSLGFNESTGGTIGFKRAAEQYDPKTGIKQIDNMIFNAKERVFQFAQKQSLTSIITQVVMSSKYIAEAWKNKTPEGYIKWFKIDVQMEYLKEDKLTLDFAKRFIYRVVPYYVHESIFLEATQVPFYDNLLEKIAKEYNYLYTGENTNILKFEIKIDNQFYQGAIAAPAKDNAKVNNPDQQASASDPQEDIARKDGGSEKAKETVGRARKRKSPEALARAGGGSGYRSSEQEIAEDFHRAFVGRGSADLIEVDLEILGDTYWLVDSGYGNYFSRVNNPTDQVNNDGSMNYEGGDIYVYLRFRTPADIDETTGLYNFNGKTRESPFGGIYRVTEVINVFADGVWKQTLKLVRMPGPQGPELQGKPAAARTEAPGYESRGLEPQNTTVANESTSEDPTKTVEGIEFTI